MNQKCSGKMATSLLTESHKTIIPSVFTLTSSREEIPTVHTPIDMQWISIGCPNWVTAA